MNMAEATIPGRQFTANLSRAAGQTPRRRLANLLRKYHLMKPEPTPKELCSMALQKAVQEAGMMNLDAALELADMALWHETDDIQAIIIKGLIYMEKGEADLAVAEFDKAVEIAKKMSGAASNEMPQLERTLVENYISMRRNTPAGHIPAMAYTPVDQAIVTLCIGAFDQAKKDFGFAVRLSTEKTSGQTR